MSRGIVAIHREITQRIAWTAQHMLAALDGGRWAKAWSVKYPTNASSSRSYQAG